MWIRSGLVFEWLWRSTKVQHQETLKLCSQVWDWLKKLGCCSLENCWNPWFTSFFYRVLPRNCCFLLGCWMRCFLLKLSLRRFRISDPGQVSDSERALFEKNQRHHTHTVLFLVILIICSGLEDSTWMGRCICCWKMISLDFHPLSF